MISHFSRYPCPPYKIIVLDEADHSWEDLFNQICVQFIFFITYFYFIFMMVVLWIIMRYFLCSLFVLVLLHHPQGCNTIKAIDWMSVPLIRMPAVWYKGNIFCLNSIFSIFYWGFICCILALLDMFY